MGKNDDTYIPPIKNINIYASNSRLFIPPVIWKGNPRLKEGEVDSFYYIVRGEIFVSLENKNFIVKEGQLLHLPQKAIRAHAPISANLILYEVSFRAEIDGQNLFNYLRLNDGNHVVDILDREKIMKVFEETSASMPATDYAAYIIRASNVSRIISMYVDAKMNSRKADSPFDEVVDHMEKNLSENVTLNSLADIAYLQPTYFIRCFKKQYGVSPITFYNQMRAERAAHLILNSNLSFEQIGRKIGIKDKYYFSNFFKHHTGKSPGEYKKLLKIIKGHNL